MLRRGFDMSPLAVTVQQLAADASLPLRTVTTPSTACFSGFRECHIAPGWLLVYEIDNVA